MFDLSHHLPAVYAMLACIVLPVGVGLVARYLVRRQQRLAREAMQRGNVLHKRWLEQSKQPPEQLSPDR